MKKYEEYLLQVIKYQQSILDKYKDYIENMIHKEIIEDIPSSLILDTPVSLKFITIPEVKLAIKCDPYVLKQWEWLKMETPIIDYNKITTIVEEMRKDELKKTYSN